MLQIIQRLLEQAVKDQINALFTYRNLQAVRDKVVAALDDMTGKTVTPYDDIIWRVARRLFDDDNLAELYSWIRDNFAYVNAMDKTCKSVAVDLIGLQDRLEVTEPNKAAAIPWATIETVLRVIIPILIEWCNK